MKKCIEIEKLYQQLLESGNKLIKYKDYEIIECKNLKIRTFDNKFVNLICLSRHKTIKDLISIQVKVNEIFYNIIVTSDHICMVLNRDKFFTNIDAKNLKIGDYVSIFDEKQEKEILGTVKLIKNIGKTENYVYDCEVDDEKHSFYANNILIHNSQFLNLQCVSKYIRNKYNLPKVIREWPQKYRQEMWDILTKFVNTEVNNFVRELVHNYCHTNQQDVLTYELEYMSDVGIYEGKKHYATHKIFDEGDPVDKTKYSGIELKKAQVPKEMKIYLAEIYNSVLLKDWNENNYNDYIVNLFNKFKTFSIDQISFWKGYNTERKAVGFLEMSKGTTGIAKACTYTNQILAKLGLSKKYDEIRVGDKVRFCYIEENNLYRINCIAYKPGQYPEEFKKIFRPDYYKMFTKLILDPLKRFREACKFSNTDPTTQPVFDIFEL